MSQLHRALESTGKAEGSGGSAGCMLTHSLFAVNTAAACLLSVPTRCWLYSSKTWVYYPWFSFGVMHELPLLSALYLFIKLRVRTGHHGPPFCLAALQATTC